ncbi:hypothetical protein VTO73DRAFT_9121 [Trametes versicolor]
MSFRSPAPEPPPADACRLLTPIPLRLSSPQPAAAHGSLAFLRSPFVLYLPAGLVLELARVSRHFSRL